MVFKKNIVLILVKMIRKTLLRAIVVGVKTITIEEREIRLNSEHSKHSWGL